MNVNLTRPILYLLFLCMLSACENESEITPNKLPQETQELKNLLNKNTDADTRLAVYYQLYKNYRTTDLTQAAHYANQQRGLAEQLDNTLYLGRAYHALGALQEQAGEYIEAVNAYLHAIDAFEEIGYTAGVATDFNYLGLVFLHTEGYKDAIPYFEKAAETYREIGDLKNLSAVYSNLAICNTKEGNFTEAAGYLINVIDFQQQLKDNDNEWLAYYYNELARVYYFSRDYNRAIQYYKKALELSKSNESVYVSHYGIANVYIAQSNDENANNWLEQAISIQTEGLKNKDIIKGYNVRGELYQLQGNHQKAAEVFEKAITLANKEIINEPLSETLDLLSQSYRALTDNGAKVAYDDIYRIADLKKQQQELKDNFYNGMNAKALQAALNQEVEAHNHRKLQASMVDRQWLIAQGAGAIVAGLLLVIMIVTINTKATKKKACDARKLCAVLEEKNDALSKENKDYIELFAEIRRMAKEVDTYNNKNKDA